MFKRLIPQVILLLAYELLVILGLIAAVRWLTIQQASPIVRGVVFLAGMALFMPPLFYLTTRPYRVPGWMRLVQSQGACAGAEVLENEHIGDYWRPQDMTRYVTVKVRVQQQPGETFNSRLVCRLDQAQSLPVGKEVAVRYDPRNRGNVALEADEFESTKVAG